MSHTTLQIVDIDLGSGVPLIHNLQAMPSPGSAIWPQLLLDFEYEGKPLKTDYLKTDSLSSTTVLSKVQWT